MKLLITFVGIVSFIGSAFASSSSLHMKRTIQECISADKVELQENGYLRISVSPTKIKDLRDHTLVGINSKEESVRVYNQLVHSSMSMSPDEFQAEDFMNSTYRLNEGDMTTRRQLLLSSLKSSNAEVGQLVQDSLVKAYSGNSGAKNKLIAYYIFELMWACENNDSSDTKLVKINMRNI